MDDYYTGNDIGDSYESSHEMTMEEYAKLLRELDGEED